MPVWKKSEIDDNLRRFKFTFRCHTEEFNNLVDYSRTINVPNYNITDYQEKFNNIVIETNHLIDTFHFGRCEAVYQILVDLRRVHVNFDLYVFIMELRQGIQRKEDV